MSLLLMLCVDTIQSGDTCTSVETKYSIAFTDLLKWNPELNVACTSTSRLLSSFVRFN
jgi:hypothetical protein